MNLISARDAAEKWGISQRRVATLCTEGRIAQATMVGNTWVIPADAQKPKDGRSTRYTKSDEKKVKPFLKWAGGKGQLLSEIEKYYPFSDEKITKYAKPLWAAVQSFLTFSAGTRWRKSTSATLTLNLSTLTVQFGIMWGN